MPQHCPYCATEVPPASRFCPTCGQEVLARRPEAADATRTSLPEPRSSAPRRSQPDADRFIPGTMLVERYRIAGLLGRGGMGEVYRADDLKLGQTVALKFLPREMETDPGRLERLMDEVRLALRVTHPNVCRVYDVGEAHGHHFISMEYVDGEDLASLLRRIGRLPEERGVEIARQICSGLAAAHEQGILHRDLKPANVMIDGRGRARITDFGLAGLSGTIEGVEARAGTPAYMAPEQLAGGKVTMRSDVYALGLVMYEIFTGKPAFEVRSAAEMAQRQRSAPPTAPSSHVRNLDPAIEAVLLRMLETDPARRPASAVAVAAALPGGDPLAAAIAAGETPSPEMVAEAGESGGLAPHWVGLLLAAVVAGALLQGWLRPHNDVLGSIETPLSTTTLAERARSMAERLGFDANSVDSASGIGVNDDYMRWMNDAHLGASKMRERVKSGRPEVYRVWYRQAAQELRPKVESEWVGPDDPPLTEPGMLLLQVDAHARLVELTAVPPQRESTDSSADVDDLWDSFFAEAGLKRATFREVTPSWTPPFYADARAGWEGVIPGAGEEPLRIEAAAFQGHPVSFRIIGPWTGAGRKGAESGQAADWLGYAFVGVFVGLLVGLGLLARRNLHRGRSDLRGAIRVGLFILFTEATGTMLSGYLFVTNEIGSRFGRSLSFIALVSSLVFLSYVALEPFVRRTWPTTLISWTRLVTGRFRDPLVGRDLLIGAATGMFFSFLWAAHTRLPGLLGLAEEPLWASAGNGGLNVATQIGRAVGQASQSVGQSMVLLLAFVLLRLVLRTNWMAVPVYLLITSVLPQLDSPHATLDIAVSLVVSSLTLFVVLRVGLLALMSCWFFELTTEQIATLDPSSWMWTSSVVYLVALVPVMVWASIAALSGRKWLADEV